jgi:sugar lactone lactonase YvrE
LASAGGADPTSIAKDASGRIYVANEEGGTNRSGSVTIFPAGSTGAVLPIAAISGVHTGLSNPVGIALDSAGNIYVSNLGGGPTNDGSVTEYAVGSNGDVAPIATITSTGFAVGFPHGIALDPAGNIYVANFIGNNGSISVFAPGSNGNATPIASIAGSNTGIQGPYGVALDSSGNIYVSNHGGGEQNTLSSITVYAPGSNGNVFPIATIIGSDTLLNVPMAIGLDLFGNIYAANSSVVINGVAYTSGVITVYPPGSSGDVSPSSIIYGNDTGLAIPAGILVDSSIYVANEAGNLTVYSLDANGDAAPAATLSNPATGLNGPTAIAFDSNRKAYVANSFNGPFSASGSVTVYSPGGYGVAGAPSATIIGSNTGLTSPSGIALDTTGNIYVSNASGGSSSSGSVTVYAPGSNGNVTPSATIISPDIFDPTGVAVDSLGSLYVTCSIVMGHSIGYTVDIFPALSNGNVIPSSMIMGLQTQLSQPSGIALDSQRNIYVANRGSNSVTMFASGSSGNVAPSIVISGSNTGLSSPIGVGVDSSGNIYVANSTNAGGGIAGSVTVYAAGSNGNVAPIQTISGGDTGLFSPMGLALGFISQ